MSAKLVCRFFAFLIDAVLVYLGAYGVSRFFNVQLLSSSYYLLNAFFAVVYFFILLRTMRGLTIGLKIFRLKVVPFDGGELSVFGCFGRAMYMCCILSPVGALIFLTGLMLILSVHEFVKNGFKELRLFPWDVYSKTKVVCE